MKRWSSIVVWLFFFGSFLLEPVNQLKDKAFHDKDIFDTVERMKQNQIRGRFTSNAEAGECMVFDNHRIVHGRMAYSATSGDRYLRGCYADREEMRSTYRALTTEGRFKA